MHLSEITIPRWLQFSSGDNIQLHIYTDASEKAMGANAYFRITSADNTVNVALITARSKVAPVRQVTVPRLELMAALIGAELSQFVKTTFRLPDVETTHWTDSTIVVHWLRRDPNTCKPFVANRILAIRECSENGVWRHISGSDNPADVLTRGMRAERLKNSSLWWKGPEWLSGDMADWPSSHISTLTSEMQAKIDEESKCLSDPPAEEKHM